MDVAEARKRLIPIRKWQLYSKRLQRRGIWAWDWAAGIEHGYLGDDNISFLQSMASLKRISDLVSRG